MKLTTSEAARQLAKLSRLYPTEAQKAASRKNGKKGGRPEGSRNKRPYPKRK